MDVWKTLSKVDIYRREVSENAVDQCERIDKKKNAATATTAKNAATVKSFLAKLHLDFERYEGLWDRILILISKLLAE